MTVAAVLLAATTASALREVEGAPNVRRLVDTAWAGGAVPVVVVAADPDGDVATALAGQPVTLAEPAPAAGGPVGQIVRGIEVARSLVDETDAALVWPARMGWVDPETVTSLIEAHGTDGDPILRPAYDGEPGWPALVPLAHLAALTAVASDRPPDAILADLETAGLPFRSLDVGDPGTVYSLDTARDALPPFLGPPEPAAGHVHEWGAPVGDRPDDAPLEGPALAPYPAAGDPEAG